MKKLRIIEILEKSLNILHDEYYLCDTFVDLENTGDITEKESLFMVNFLKENKPNKNLFKEIYNYRHFIKGDSNKSDGWWGVDGKHTGYGAMINRHQLICKRILEQKSLYINALIETLR